MVSNWAAGVGKELLSEEDIAETLREPMARVRALVDGLAGYLKASEALQND